MTQQAKKLNLFSQKILLFGISAFILIILVTFSVLAFRPNAELIVLVAPSKATILLDGKKIHNGTQAIRAGKHTLKATLNGLETKTQEIELSANETKSVNLYLTGENDDFSYYLKDEEDIDLLAMMDDEKAIKFVSEYRTAKTITELLPITIVQDYGEASSKLELGENCTRSYCLKITDSGAELKEMMFEKIKSLGYNPDDYEIQYELLDEEDED
ncbi:hypothetical protein IIZ81_00580 [Candidatus Saccharibacteria bacterium]|nr:hypothetical protein [Candidatus Saccharibacteria bacterium]